MLSFVVYSDEACTCISRHAFGYTREEIAKKHLAKSLGTNSTRFHVEITIINFIYYYYLTIGGLGFGVWGFGFGVLGLGFGVWGFES